MTIEEMSAELECLRGEIRRLRKAALVALVALSCIGLYGLRSTSEDLTVDTLRARKVIVDDGTSPTFARLSVDLGTPSLSFPQRNGKMRLRLVGGLLPGGGNIREVTGLQIFDKDGLGRIQVALWDAGEHEDASVSLYQGLARDDSNLHPEKVALGMIDGKPSIRVTDVDRKTLFSVPGD